MAACGRRRRLARPSAVRRQRPCDDAPRSAKGCCCVGQQRKKRTPQSRQLPDRSRNKLEAGGNIACAVARTPPAARSPPADPTATLRRCGTGASGVSVRPSCMQQRKRRASERASGTRAHLSMVGLVSRSGRRWPPWCRWPRCEDQHDGAGYSRQQARSAASVTYRPANPTETLAWVPPGTRAIAR